MSAAPSGTPGTVLARVFPIVHVCHFARFFCLALMALIVLIALWLPTGAVAAAAATAPTPSGKPVATSVAIDLATAPSPLKLDTQLRMLEDPTRRLDATQALAAPGWRQVVPRMLNAGYSRSAFWLTGNVENLSAAPVTRWLSVGIVRLEDIRFYAMPFGATQPSVSWRAGHTVPLTQHPIASETSVFPITLAPGERMTFLVRVETRSSVSLVPHLWRPDDFRMAEAHNAMIAMLLAGSMISIGLYALVLGIARRDPVFVLLALTTITQVAQDMAFQGFLYRYVLPQGGEFIVRAPSFFSTLTAGAFSAMLLAFAGLNGVALWRWTYRVMIGIMGFMAVWVLFGDHRVAAFTHLQLLTVFNVIWVVSLIDGWRRGCKNARLSLLSFSPGCVVLFWRLAIINGLLPEEWLANTAMAWSTNISVLLMLTIIVAGRSRELVREQRAAQREVLQTRREEQARLANAVDTRTRELQAALIAADEANSAKSDFLARISHDLRTPLTSIIGFADLVQSGGREDADRGRIIRRSAHHMLAMVNDLIEYAGGGAADALHVAPVYTHAFIDNMAHEGMSLARKHDNAFLLDVRAPLPPLLAFDAKRVRQVLGNLLDNAAKYTTDGTITLSLSATPDATRADIVHVCFGVEDSGCGIAKEDLPRVFEPFARLDGARRLPGVGLGLAIVKQWIERMNGTIAIDSTPDVGTRVTFSLPLHVARETDLVAQSFAGATHALPPLDGTGYHIWLAEDSPEIRQFLHDELASLGFSVRTFGDGVALIAALGNPRQTLPDLVLTDHMMPNADGLAVARAVRRRWPDVPVLAVSASPQVVAGSGVGRAAGEEGSEADDDARGYDACLLKPVELADLRHTLARLLDLQRIDAPLAADADGEADADSAALVRPSRDLLVEARQLIAMGAITDLMDWARHLSTLAPQYDGFAHHVHQLAQRGDLAGLETLCAAPY
ncbi:Sensor protein EvgS [Pandoraea capi]|uniref:histidine kinase n=1 Tax=Pandoraea capi TaxID=2508286 RepID=A0ABY6VQF4_9BURK|nr:hybrid sensor histidine kinase/response regulator [Pandoraea capi]VVD67783.1 Sensor protein EvgS [Pandoraea capi]